MRLAADPGDEAGRDLADRCLAPLVSRGEVPSLAYGSAVRSAWHHSRRGPREIIWHNGMTGGFSAMIAFDPGRGLGVAALADTAGAPPSPLDDAVFAAARTTPAQRTPYRYSSASWSRCS